MFLAQDVSSLQETDVPFVQLVADDFEHMSPELHEPDVIGEIENMVTAMVVTLNSCYHRCYRKHGDSKGE